MDTFNFPEVGGFVYRGMILKQIHAHVCTLPIHVFVLSLLIQHVESCPLLSTWDHAVSVTLYIPCGAVQYYYSCPLLRAFIAATSLDVCVCGR